MLKLLLLFGEWILTLMSQIDDIVCLIVVGGFSWLRNVPSGLDRPAHYFKIIGKDLELFQDQPKVIHRPIKGHWEGFRIGWKVQVICTLFKGDISKSALRYLYHAIFGVFSLTYNVREVDTNVSTFSRQKASNHLSEGSTFHFLFFIFFSVLFYLITCLHVFTGL